MPRIVYSLYRILQRLYHCAKSKLFGSDSVPGTKAALVETMSSSNTAIERQAAEYHKNQEYLCEKKVAHHCPIDDMVVSPQSRDGNFVFAPNKEVLKLFEKSNIRASMKELMLLATSAVNLAD